MPVTTEDPRVSRSKTAVRQATLEVLSERGVADTTIEAIAAKSGVAKTTIYRHWTDRSTLILEVLESLIQPPRDPDTGTLRGDLEVLANGLAAGLGNGAWTSLLASLVDAAERDTDLRNLHSRFADERDGIILGIVARARHRGEVRNDVEDDDIVELIAGPLFYKRLLRHRSPTADEAHRLAGLVADLARPRDTAT